MKNKAYFYLTAVLVIIFSIFGFSLNSNLKINPAKNSSSPTQTPSPNQSSSPTDTSTSSSSPSQTSEAFGIFYLVSVNGNNEIYKIDSGGEKANKIFTDADNDLKIKSVGSITADGKNILANMGKKEQDFSGTLYFISTDGKANLTKILDEFSSPQPAVVNPKGNKVAYISFNNAEDKYGFSINSIDTKGENKKEIYSTKNAIFNLAWQDDDNLVFPETKESGGSIIKKINASTDAKSDIADLKGLSAFSLTASKEKFAFASGTGNETEIYTIDKDGKNLKKITSNDTQENFLQFSPLGQKIVYLKTKFTKSNPQTSGIINIIDSDDANAKDLTPAQSIIGTVSR